MNDTMIPMPVPVPDAHSRPYWEGANEGRFMFQRCGACGRAQFYPRSLCSHCRASEIRWEQARGTGRIASYSVVHRASTKAFAAVTPYVVALVDLDEGIRFMCNVVASEPSEVGIGRAVRVVFETRPGSGQKIPQVELI